ncbi:MAG: GNAT family N-acetyltransferase [Thermoanaerobaculia bacterium]
MPGDVVYQNRGAEGLVAARAFLERVVSEEYDPVVSTVVRADAAAHTAGFDPEHDALFTAERDGRLVGVLLITRDAADPDTCRFDWLMVDASERNGGVGRELLFRGIEACREKRRLVLRARSFAASPAGPHLFWLYGFRVVDLVPVMVGQDTRESILFEKRLNPPASPEA